MIGVLFWRFWRRIERHICMYIDTLSRSLSSSFFLSILFNIQCINDTTDTNMKTNI